MIKKQTVFGFCWGSVFFLGIILFLPKDGLTADFEKDQLTQEEQGWLKAHPVIRLGVDSDFEPYSFRDRDGQYHGIAIEYSKYISEQLGVSLEVVSKSNWLQIMDGVRDHRLDLVATTPYNQAQRDSVNLSEAYLSEPLVIMRRSGDTRIKSEADLGNSTVAMVEGYSSSAQVIGEYPNASLMMVKTALDGLLAVANGKADVYIGVLGVNSYLMQKNDITNLEIVSLYGEDVNTQYFSVRKDWPGFVSIINKVIDQMPIQKKTEIYNKWEMNPLSKAEQSSSNQAGFIFKSLAIVFFVITLVVFVFWVTRRLPKQSEKELKQFKSTLDQTMGCVFMFDAKDLLFTYSNAGAMQQVGYTYDELLSMHPYDINPLYSEARFKERLVPLFSGEKESITYETVLRQKTGQEVNVEIFLQYIAPENEESRFVAIVKEITELKIAEQTLRESEERIRAIVDTVVDGIITISDKGIMQTFNASAEYIFGYAEVEVIGNNVSMLMPEHYHSEHDSYLEKYLQTGDAKVIGIGRKVVGQRKDGTTFPMELAVNQMEVNGTLSFTGIVRDICDSEAIQKKVEQQQSLIKMLHESITTFVETGDFSNTMNGMLNTLLELTDSEYGFTGEVLYDEEGNPSLKTHAITNIAWDAETQAIDEEGIEKGFEFRNLDTLLGYVVSSRQTVVSNNPASDPRSRGLLEGHSAMNSFLGVPVFYGTELVGVYGIANCPGGYDKEIQDFLSPFNTTYGVLIRSKQSLDKEEQYRKELLEAKELAEGASKAKSQFLSSMSHELRTPLNAIMGLAQLFEYKKDLTKANKDNAREIYNAGAHLLLLINEVLDLATIESGKLKLSMEAILTSDMLDECKSIIAPLAESKNISLDFSIGPCKDLYVKADYTRFKQVFLNLLSNAVKYNRYGGHVSISCTIGEMGFIRIAIKDTGVGLTENNLSKLFQPFNRLEVEHGNIQGTGIGLVITKELVELMGGLIGVESIPGKGSTFWVEFQPAPSGGEKRVSRDIAAEQAPTQIKPMLYQAHILIAEDNVTNQFVLQQQMELLGISSELVDNGVQAWNRLQCGKYDLLLTDILMPLMNGYELVSKIRKSEQGTDQHLPIIAITANAMKEDEKRCLENGMDAFIAKPIHINGLKAVLEEWLPKEKTEGLHLANKIEAPTESPVDISMLIGLIGDDKEKHCLLVKVFMDSTPDIILEMQAAYQEQISREIEQQAHKLKSSAKFMGAHLLADACQALEVAGKEHQWAEIDNILPRVDVLFNSVKAYFDDYCGVEQVLDPEKPIAIEQLKILLLDDDPLMLDMEMMVLDELGITNVVTATSGEVALKAINNAVESIDVVMCDLKMPEMDGVEFLRHLATQNYAGGVLLVSEVDVRLLRTAEILATKHHLNVLGVLEKPVRPNDLKKLLAKLTSVSPKKALKGTAQERIVVTVKELRQAIENDELVTFFQPKVDVITREVVSIETLVRWQHPEKGLIPPDMFISVAEENGLIDILTKAVYFKAVQHATNLKNGGFDLSVAVNISIDTLNDLSWPEYAMALVRDAGIEPSKIIFEVTESRLIDNLTSALEVLSRLSLKKFKLSIDDFGTGYSSMEQLQRFPFSELKIDRAFVNGAAHDRSSRAILESSIDLARKLDLSVVAEGVETQEDWDLVSELGCDLVQGYFIAKPMPINELLTWLSQWNK